MRQDTASNQTCRPGLSCLPPWFMLRRRFRKNGKEMDNKSRICEPSSSSSSSSPKGGDVATNVPAEIGSSFNLGVGFGVIYVVREELNKMVELRREVEVLIQELRRSKSRVSSSLSIANADNNEEICSNQLQLSHHDVEMLETCFASNRHRRDKNLRMDQLEAELEAEFDRLRLSSDSFNYSRQQYTEVNVEDMSEPEVSHTAYYEEENYEAQDEFYAVSPRELESRLHEVLETRQQEKIDELESALEYAMHQLEEKEREIACWKDAARFVSRHFPDMTAGMLGQGKEEDVCVFETEEVEAMGGKSLVNSSE